MNDLTCNRCAHVVERQYPWEVSEKSLNKNTPADTHWREAMSMWLYATSRLVKMVIWRRTLERSRINSTYETSRSV